MRMSWPGLPTSLFYAIHRKEEEFFLSAVIPENDTFHYFLIIFKALNFKPDLKTYFYSFY